MGEALRPGGGRRRQDLPRAFMPNGAVYVAETSWFRRARDFYAEGALGHAMPAERSIDIDDEMDLLFAEALLARRDVLNPTQERRYARNTLRTRGHEAARRLDRVRFQAQGAVGRRRRLSRAAPVSMTRDFDSPGALGHRLVANMARMTADRRRQSLRERARQPRGA
jgi:hypothetical protein